MNRLYKNLHDVLEQKIGLYESFIQLLNHEWKCVSQYSYDDLGKIIAKKDDHVMQMQALENSRSSLMKKIAENLNIKPSGLTLKKLTQKVSYLNFLQFFSLNLIGYFPKLAFA